jgi:hypothetical protein
VVAIRLANHGVRAEQWSVAAALGVLLVGFAAPAGTDPVVVLALAGLLVIAALAVAVLAGLALATAPPSAAGRASRRPRRAVALPTSGPGSRPRPRAPGSEILAG